MTTSAARCPANRDGLNAVQTYMTSILYLREEARRDGFDAVADILWNALTAIETWLETGQGPVGSGDILDKPLCQSLEFLIGWMALPKDKQLQVARDIARYEAAQDGERAVAPSRRRISKTTVK